MRHKPYPSHYHHSIIIKILSDKSFDGTIAASHILRQSNPFHQEVDAIETVHTPEMKGL